MSRTKSIKYSRLRILHAGLSAWLLDFIASLWKFQGGPIRRLQRFHASWNRRVFHNEIPPDTQLNLEQISMSYILPFGTWLTVQRGFAKALHGNRLRDRFWSMSYGKILENIEEINQSTVHSASWRNLGQIEINRGKLRKLVESVEIHLYSLRKGHILILFQVRPSAHVQEKLEGLFKKRFRDLVFLNFGRNFWKSMGFSTESATLYKRHLINRHLSELKQEIYDSLLKSLKLPKVEQPLSSVDLYSLNTKDPNIFQYEFWSCLNHQESLPGYFILPNDPKYTLSITNGHEHRDLKIIGDLRHFSPEKGYASLRDQLVDKIEHYTRELLQVWIYHSTYFFESNRISHDRFELPKIYRKYLSLGVYRKESDLKARAFDVDMLSKDYAITDRIDDVATSSFAFTEKFGLPQASVPLSEYLRDGIKYFKDSYRKSWKEIEPFVTSFVELKNASLNRNLQIILAILVLCEFMSSDWGENFREEVHSIFVGVWSTCSAWLGQ